MDYDKVNKTKLNIINIVKTDDMAELFHWIALDCVGVPNKVAAVCKKSERKTDTMSSRLTSCR